MVRFMNFLPFLSFLPRKFSIWASYGIQQEDVAIVRTNLLLRCLVVDSEPFEEILFSCFNHLTSPSQKRFVLFCVHAVCGLTCIQGYQASIDCSE